MSVRSNKENITDESILIPSCIVKLLKYFSKSDIATIYQDDDYIKNMLWVGFYNLQEAKGVTVCKL